LRVTLQYLQRLKATFDILIQVRKQSRKLGQGNGGEQFALGADWGLLVNKHRQGAEGLRRHK
jgi:hypothetical protein